MEDSYANLIYQGKKSSDLGVLIQYPFNLTHPIPDIDPTHIKGRSGDFLQSDNSTYFLILLPFSQKYN